MKHRFGFSSFSRSFSQHPNRKRQTKKKRENRVRLTSTVGFPRLSKIWRAFTTLIVVIVKRTRKVTNHTHTSLFFEFSSQRRRDFPEKVTMRRKMIGWDAHIYRWFVRGDHARGVEY